jgi:hypothetical protein
MPCEELRAAWLEIVGALDRSCDRDTDCRVVSRAGYCDSSTDVMSGECGWPARADAYAESAAFALEQEWDARGCTLDGISDCGDDRVGCPFGVCEIVASSECEIIDPDPFNPTRRGDAVARPDVHLHCVRRSVPMCRRVARAAPSTVTISRSSLAAPSGWSSPGSYRVLAGLGATEPSVDFLSATDVVTVSKVTGPMTEAFSADLVVPELAVLDDLSHRLDSVPLDGSAARFSCTGAGGSCGSALLSVVHGRTTPASPGGAFATWQCAGFSGDIEVAPGAMTAMLATAPATIEMRHARVNLSLVGNADGTNATTIIVGHELAGVTPVP